MIFRVFAVFLGVIERCLKNRVHWASLENQTSGAHSFWHKIHEIYHFLDNFLTILEKIHEI